MKKTLVYIAILAVLGFGVWYFLFSDRKVGEAGFTVADTGSIAKIFIAPNSNLKTITLERKPDGWEVNGEYRALQSSVNQLLITIHNQRALYPIPDNQRDAVVRSLIGGAIKVELYDREGRQMRSFYVGNEMNRFSGTAMLKEGSERPYVVQIPGFDGYLTTRYSADIGTWRDRIVYDLQPDQIAEVEVRYPNTPADNFTIISKDGKIEVLLDPGVRPAGELNLRRVNSYLGFFKRMYNENYQSYPGMDTVVAKMPELATVRVKATDGRETTARFLLQPVEEGTDEELAARDADRYSTDRYYAILNGGKDTATVQVPTFERLFRKGPEFYTPDQKGRIKIPGVEN